MRGSQTKFSYFDAVEWRARQSPYLFHARWFNGLSSGSQVFIVVVSARTNKSHHHHGCVDIWKTLKAVSQMRDCPVCDCRKDSPLYPYHTVSAGVLGGTGYPTTARPTAFCAPEIWECCCCLLHSTYYKAVRVGGGDDDAFNLFLQKQKIG